MVRQISILVCLAIVFGFVTDVRIESRASAQSSQQDGVERGQGDEAETRRERRLRRRNRALRAISKFDDDNNRSLDVLELAGAIRAMIDALAGIHNGVLDATSTQGVRPNISPRGLAESLISEFDRTGDEELNGFELDRAMDEIDDAIRTAVADSGADQSQSAESPSGDEADSNESMESSGASEDTDAGSEEASSESEQSPSEGPCDCERNCPLETEGQGGFPIPLPRPF